MELPVQDVVDHGIKLIEEERRRIARDLHDGPAQTLTHISMRLDVIRQLMLTDMDMATEELARTNSRIVTAVNDIRRLIFDLRPIAIDEVGLLSACDELCHRFERDHHTSVTLYKENLYPLQLSPAKQVSLYRLFQEIMNNIHKHANATSVIVRIAQDSEHFSLEICDDGQGFDPDKVPEGHYGLLGIQERVTYIGGNLSIDAAIGQGSRFLIMVPSHAS